MNVLTNVGKQILTGFLNGASSGPGSARPLHIGWGSGTGVSAAADTTLFTEETEARSAGVTSRETTSTTNDTYQVSATIVALSAKTITNAGLFDAGKAEGAVPGGNLFVKGDFAGIPLEAGDSISITFKWQIQ